jgi:creatinine amidohydrolase
VSEIPRQMSHMTWPEVQAVVERGGGVILPLGATEQHGLHLPLACDAICATDLALAVAEATDCVVAPAIVYGYRSRPMSGGGQGFIGTTGISGETLILTVRDLVREFLRHGFRRIVLLNWHNENSSFMYEGAYVALEERPNEAAKVLVLESPFERLSDATMEDLFGGDFPGWPTEHAAILETSVMLHLHPDLVHFERAVDDQVARATSYEVLPVQPEFVTESGSLWKATRASAAKGERAWKEIVAPLVEAILTELPLPADSAANR